MLTKKIVLYCDGGARGNPGPAASAFAVLENNKAVYKESLFLGKTTNNVAEYQSVVIALKWLSKQKSKQESIKVVVDSQLVFRQLNGEYKIKKEELKKLAIKIKQLEKKIKSEIIFDWLPRSKNKIADKLVNKELDKNI